MLWKIAVAGKDSAVDFASQELERCLKAMDEHAEIAVMRYSVFRPELPSLLWLGVCPHVQAEVCDPKYDDAYWIDVDNAIGAIRGSNARSVLMGVYRFLRELGCSWVRPGADGEYLPKIDADNHSVHIHEAASYRHRGICIEGAVSYEHVRDTIDWMPKLGYNAYYNQFNNPVTFYDRWYSHKDNPNLNGIKLTSAEVEGLRDSSVFEMKKRGLLYHAAGHGWTCEPFGIPGEAWEPTDSFPESARKYLAKVNGKRDLWGGVALNTNLCYSNPTVRKKIVDAVSKRCAEIPDIDFMHVWLADGSNNHCECENCRKKRASDWYVTLLNEIDAQLTRRKITTKIVFLIYVDLLWNPVAEKLTNPERFVLMFAPISRTYSSSIAEAAVFDENALPDYKLNKLQFPSSVSENLAWLRKWQKDFKGDGFDFDYHFMWDHFHDPGYYETAETLFRDMQGLHKVGLNGMVSCQNQRVFFPTGLGMTAMAAALWNENSDFEQIADEYFTNAFGDCGKTIQNYMRSLSEAFCPSYFRGEMPIVDTDAARRFASVQDILSAHQELIYSQAENETLPKSRKESWKLLVYHAELCAILARCFALKAEGNFDKARTLLDDVLSYARLHESILHHVFDVCLFQSTITRAFERGIK